MKGLEALKQIKSSYKYDYELQDFLKPIEMELKALEIIKQYILICNTAGGMGKELGFDWNKNNLYLTQQEYDLLKEVLKDE